MRSEGSGVNGNWIDLFPQEDLASGQARLVEIDDITIAVYNLQGEYFALEDFCTHDRFQLIGSGLPQDLMIHGEQITCPRHGARFSIRTGEALSPPAYEPLGMFPVRILNGVVQIRDNRTDG